MHDAKRGILIVYSESRASAKFLLDRGVKQNEILIEDTSLDTIGNAYFLRLLHVEPLRLRRIHIITNHFHMHRTGICVFSIVFWWYGMFFFFKII